MAEMAAGERVIKFRAWDIRGKRMWWNVQDAYDTLGSHHTPDPEAEKNGLDDEFDPCCFGDAINKPDQYVLMQFTGLKDKNGREIWEGDIVKSPAVAPDSISTVYFKQEHFSGFYLLTSEGRSTGLAADVGDLSPEVIGNMHENGDLFK